MGGGRGRGEHQTALCHGCCVVFCVVFAVTILLLTPWPKCHRDIPDPPYVSGLIFRRINDGGLSKSKIEPKKYLNKCGLNIGRLNAVTHCNMKQ